MVDVLQKALSWLEGKRHKLRTVEVTYCRGLFTVRLAATIGKTVFETQDARGIIEKTEARDFLVRGVDLILDGSRALPKRGDCIRETGEDQLYIYEVMAPNREPEWRWSDPYRQTLRIHTKQVDVEETP